MQKAIIIGATSGIGQEVARILVQQGWHIGIAGRRKEALHALQTTAPDRIVTEQLDVTEETATLHLHNLIEKLGGMDLFFLSSGVGHQNRDLQPDIELNTARTNVEGFTRMVTAAFNYFKEKGSGHIAVISSIAGTKGLGVAPAYSATKRFQNTYIEALAQLARMQHLVYTLHRHPSGICCHRFTEKREIPDADESRPCSTAHNQGFKRKETGSCH